MKNILDTWHFEMNINKACEDALFIGLGMVGGVLMKILTLK